MRARVQVHQDYDDVAVAQQAAAAPCRRFLLLGSLLRGRQGASSCSAYPPQPAPPSAAAAAELQAGLGGPGAVVSRVWRACRETGSWWAAQYAALWRGESLLCCAQGHHRSIEAPCHLAVTCIFHLPPLPAESLFRTFHLQTCMLVNVGASNGHAHAHLNSCYTL